MTSLLLRNKQKTLGGLFRDLGPFMEGALCALGHVRAIYPMSVVHIPCARAQFVSTIYSIFTGTLTQLKKISNNLDRHSRFLKYRAST